MNFHPDKQLFQVAGARDRTTDPWITKPALYLYTMGDPLMCTLLQISHCKYLQCIFDPIWKPDAVVVESKVVVSLL